MANKPHIIGFIGAKGGTGISSLVANMGVVLSRLGHRTLLVDGSVWGQGIFSYLGDIGLPPEGMREWNASQRTQPLEKFWVDTIIPGLFLLSGLQHSGHRAHPGFSSRPDAYGYFGKIDIKYILLDLGNVASEASLDFWLHCDDLVLVTIPEPAAVANTNALLTKAYTRLAATHAKRHHLDSLLSEAIDNVSRERHPQPVEWLRYVIERDPPKGEMLRARMVNAHISLILNRSNGPDDTTMAEDLVFLWKRHFGVDFDFIGSIAEDSAFGAAARKRMPVILLLPNSRGAENLERLVHNLIFKTRFETTSRSKNISVDSLPFDDPDAPASEDTP